MNVITEFEREFCKFTGAKHSIACCNGTSALHTALHCVGVSRGDAVLTTPLSFISSSNAILYCDGKPIFVDINPKTYCLDAGLVEEALRRNDINTVLCVHLFGNMCDLSTLVPVCKRYGVHLVEDCAQALGKRNHEGQHVGTFGNMGTFSFYTSKNLWTFEGGMLTTNDELLAEKARSFINHGRQGKNPNVHVALGYNYRMPEVCALMGLRMLQRHKKAIMAELGSYGPSDGYYPYVIYNQPFYKLLGIKGNCPIAERIAKEVRQKNRYHK